MSNESQLNYCMLSICKPLLLLNVKFYIDPTTKTTVERVTPSRQVQQRKKSINSILKRHQVCA